MPSNVTLKALGLNTSPNSIDVPEGSLLTASNVIIRRDNVVESRRGYKLYGNSYGNPTDNLKQFISYKQKILRHYSNILEYQSGDLFYPFSQSVSEVESGLRIKSLELNGNLYLTSSEGIKKISVKSASDLAIAKITSAGGLKALDAEAKLNVILGDTTGFLTEDSTVSYRVVWGLKDANNNLILGSPSPLIEVYNSLTTLLLRDYSSLLNALDNISSGSMINDADYASSYTLPYSSTATQLKNKLIDLASKIDTDILYADDDGTPSAAPLTISSVPVINSGICTVTFTASPSAVDYFSTGSRVRLSGFTVGNLAKTFNSTTDVNTTTDRITITSHGFNNGDIANFSGTLPTGLSAASPYYVINVTTNDFQVSATPGGSPADITSTAVGTGTITILGSGDINGLQTVVDVTSSTITFNTSAKGSVTMSGQKIISGEYQYIIENPETENLNNFIIDTPATNDELKVLQSKIESIFTRLKAEPASVIPVNLRSAYIDNLLTTRASSVDLFITIPGNITSDHFLQIYRSAVVSAEGPVALDDLSPGDELRLVYEAFPTQTELSSRSMMVNDIVPESFRLSGANLYTNAATGDGPLQTNDIPPLAKDIELFKGYTFYANTKTQHRKSLSLLGTTKIIESYNAGNTPSLVISNGSSTNVYDFITGQKEKRTFDFSGLTGSTANGKSISISNANDLAEYVIYINSGISAIGTGATVTITTNDNHLLSNGDSITVFASNSTPSIDGTYTVTVTSPNTFDITPTDAVTIAGTTGNWQKNYTNKTTIKVDVLSADSDAQIASKVTAAVSMYTWDFTATTVGTASVIENFDYGYSTDATADSGISVSITQDGRGDKAQQETIELDFGVLTGASFTSSGSSDYLIINDVLNVTSYYLWAQVGTSTDPLIANKTGIEIALLAGDTASQIAQKYKTVLDTSYSGIFETSINSNKLTITLKKFGKTTASSAPQMPVGFTLTTLESGALDVLLSDVVSPAQAVNETSKSLIKIINKNVTEIVNGFYLSSSAQIPGTMNIESRDLSDVAFYLLANNSNTGDSFNPSLSPEIVGISNTAANPTVVTATNHGLKDGDKVVISGSNSIPSIDGVHTISNSSTNSFAIPINVTSSGNKGGIIAALAAEFSSNETEPHRLYYSKYQQPEAVPILNYIDVGAKDKAILRIMALRDSLMILKEDGLYRLSSESPPFTVSLFDSSCITVAPDSVDITNNQIFAWTTQGISTISEGGVQIITRPIDIDIIPRSSSNYINFKTATWGLGYESDNSYLAFTVNKIDDEVATVCYRFSTLTNSWTTWNKSATCGMINPIDDKMYLAPTDTNYIEQERKSFTRLDYSDRELSTILSPNNYLNGGLTIKLASVSGIEAGDVLYQNQTLTPFEFNGLLTKLDSDSTIPVSDFYSSLKMVGGDNARSKVEALASKLDSVIVPTPSPTYLSKIQTLNSIAISSNTDDSPTLITSPSHGLISGRRILISGVTGSSPSINGTHIVTVIDNNTFSIPVAVLTPGTGGTFTTQDQDFDDIKTCYNSIVSQLNVDTGVSFANYKHLDNDTEIEAVITNVNKLTKQITLNIGLEFIQGPLTVFKSINCELLYTPVLMGDPLTLKHIREATIMFANKAFTSAVLSFSSDLAPAFIEVPFTADGNGIFGHSTFGTGYFGGASNSAPFRTYIPRQHQRCRAMNVKFNHKVAREIFAIYGITLTGEVSQSTRAYR